jgi:16S rRNA (cytidine1402-2'-O)-methyltransferase
MERTKLYLVGPVGEWQDLTLRARDLLCSAGLIVVQDEGQVRRPLVEIGAQGQLLESGREDALASILAALAEGEVAWLVERIGELSGQSLRLVDALLARGVDLDSVPGASAMIGGLVAAGLPADRFTALGLLPDSLLDRRALWSRFARDPMTLVCEVRADDLGAVLSQVLAALGDRQVAIGQGRDVWRGPVSEAHPFKWDGLVTLTIAGADASPDWSRERVMEEMRALLAAGTSPRDTAREVSRRSGWPRRQVYELVVRVSREET